MKRKRQSKPGTVSVGNVTVKIYRRQRRTVLGKRRTIFEVSDYSNGKRRLRGFTDAADAKREAEKIARQLATGETTAATMRNSDAASYGRAVELLRPTGATLESASDAYAKAFGILGGDSIVEAAKFYALHRADKIERRTVKQTVDELIAAREARKKSTRYIADLRARLNQFANAFNRDVGDIVTADIQKWLDDLKVAPRTAKNFQSTAHTLFAFAESRGYILKKSNPVADTEEIDGNNDAAIEIYTPSEISKLMGSASPSFKPFLAIGAFAGLRSAEIERLDWAEVDLAGGFIEVKAAKAKTRSRRLVPILPNLSRWLASCAAQTGKVWKGTAASLIEARAETVKGAGIDWKDNALRHSFISYRLAEIQNAAQVSHEAGNSPAMVFKNYREIVKPDAAKTWFAIAPDEPANILPMAVGATG